MTRTQFYAVAVGVTAVGVANAGRPLNRDLGVGLTPVSLAIDCATRKLSHDRSEAVAISRNRFECGCRPLGQAQKVIAVRYYGLSSQRRHVEVECVNVPIVCFRPEIGAIRVSDCNFDEIGDGLVVECNLPLACFSTGYEPQIAQLDSRHDVRDLAFIATEKRGNHAPLVAPSASRSYLRFEPDRDVIGHGLAVVADDQIRVGAAWVRVVNEQCANHGAGAVSTVTLGCPQRSDGYNSSRDSGRCCDTCRYCAAERGPCGQLVGRFGCKGVAVEADPTDFVIHAGERTEKRATRMRSRRQWGAGVVQCDGLIEDGQRIVEMVEWTEGFVDLTVMHARCTDAGEALQ